MRFKKILRNITVLIFIIIILFGEGFKIKILNLNINLSSIILLFAFLIFIASNPKFYFSILDKLLIFLFFFTIYFSFFGLIRGNHPNDILEDAYPILIFIFLFFLFRNFNIEDSYFIWEAILIISLIACFKIILINFVSYDVDWSNAWQATKEPIPFTNANRIILRGGDLFFSFSFVTFLLIFLYFKIINKIYIIPFILLLFSVFISLSRSSYLAIAIAIIIVLIFYSRYFIKNRLIKLFFILITLFFLLFPFINIFNLASNIFEQRTSAFDNNNISIEFRNEERDIIFNKSKPFYYFGNGLGSYYYLAYSGSEKSDDRSIYSHDFNAWFIFKMGLLSLIIIYLIMVISFLNFHKILKVNNQEGRDNNIILFIISLQAAFVIFFVVSIFANKVNTSSGSIFFAFYAANSLNVFKNENCY